MKAFDRAFVFLAAVAAAAPLVAAAQGQQLSGAGLVGALRAGGYVIVMRHAASPREAPDARTANSDNTTRERQLDETGRATATAMGEALRRLGIPVTEILASPTYRALETIRLAGLKNPTPVNELGDGGRNMQAVGDPQAEWLQKAAARATRGNTLVVTHMPNIARAFPAAGDVADGEALVFRPDGQGGATIVARVKIEEWPRLQR